MVLAVISMTEPLSAMAIWLRSMPMSWASWEWIWSIRCSPWRGDEEPGLRQGVDDLRSSWQAWPDT